MNYQVTFFKRAKKEDEKDEVLGSVVVDDTGINAHFTLQAKAWRQATPICLIADKVSVWEI